MAKSYGGPIPVHPIPVNPENPYDLDLRRGDGAPTAFLPKDLAIKALKAYSDSLELKPVDVILDTHARDISNCITIKEAIELSKRWAHQQELLENIANDNWGPYEISY